MAVDQFGVLRLFVVPIFFFCRTSLLGAAEPMTAEEKIGRFMIERGLRSGFDDNKKRIIATGLGETRVEALCEALSEVAKGIESTVTASQTETRVKASIPVFPGLEIETNRLESIEQATRDGEAITSSKIDSFVEISFLDDQAEAALQCAHSAHRIRSVSVNAIESDEVDISVMIKSDDFNGIVDRLRAKGLHTLWWAGDDLRHFQVGVLTMIQF